MCMALLSNEQDRDSSLAELMGKGKQKVIKHKIIQILLFPYNCDNAINKIYGQIIRMHLKRNLAF